MIASGLPTFLPVSVAEDLRRPRAFQVKFTCHSERRVSNPTRASLRKSPVMSAGPPGPGRRAARGRSPSLLERRSRSLGEPVGVLRAQQLLARLGVLDDLELEEARLLEDVGDTRDARELHQDAVLPCRVTTDSGIPVWGSSTRRRITSSTWSMARSRTSSRHSSVSASANRSASAFTTRRVS